MRVIRWTLSLLPLALITTAALAHDDWDRSRGGSHGNGPDKLSDFGSVRGVVSYCGGSAGLEVFIPGQSLFAITDANGAFSLDIVPPGTWNVQVASNGRVLRTLSASVTKGKTANLSGNPALTICDDQDGDGFLPGPDCDDFNPGIRPGASDLCGDGRDNNCDGRADETCGLCMDVDGDSFPAQLGCGIVDCDDTDPTVNPGAPERCGGVDHDCDRLVDERDSIDALLFFVDSDGDGYGTDTDPVAACKNPGGYVGVGGDCDDTALSTNPGATEVCNDTVDNDCDGTIDEAECDVPRACNDEEVDQLDACVISCAGNRNCLLGCGNGVSPQCGNGMLALLSCALPVCREVPLALRQGPEAVCIYDACTAQWQAAFGVHVVPIECADNAVRTCGTDLGACVSGTELCTATRWGECIGAVGPEPESCDGIDNDCDGGVDLGASEGIQMHADSDGDGYGDYLATAVVCPSTPGWVTQAGDCNDNNPTIHPGATEVCDGVDNDCDTAVDEGYVCTPLDADGDGYSPDQGDCDDGNPEINPEAFEDCQDGIDNDCDGAVDSQDSEECP